MTAPLGAADYLNRSGSVQLDINGNGTVTLRPDVGQWWAPKFVRVSTLIQQTPVAYCVVYHGAVTVKNQTTFLDDTFLGNGDSSSIVSGTVVQFGEAITAVWTGGNPGDTAVLTLYGISSSVPPSIGEMPSVPGTHFAGHLNTEVLTKLAGVPVGSPVTMPANTTITLSPDGTTTTAFDVRNFASYYFKMLIQVSGTGTRYNFIPITLFWVANSNGTELIYEEFVTIWADGSGIAAFTVNSGPLVMQDYHHGPYFLVTINNPPGQDTMLVNYNLSGSTRSLSGPSFKQLFTQDGILNNSAFGIPAGGSLTFPLGFAYGPVQLQMINAGAANQTFKMDFAGSSVTNNTVAVVTPAAPNQYVLFVMPKRSGLVTVTGTVGEVAGLRAITQYTKLI